MQYYWMYFVVLVIEAHSEHVHPDLRLANPFAELSQLCDSVELDSLTKKEHSHVPWLVLVYKYLQVYKTEVVTNQSACFM